MVVLSDFLGVLALSDEIAGSASETRLGGRSPACSTSPLCDDDEIYDDDDTDDDDNEKSCMK